MKHKAIILVGTTVFLIIGAGAWLFAQGPQPAFGPLTATPSGYLATTPTAVPNIVVNTPTIVRFQIPIPTPTLNPTTVVLERVDASGQILGTEGRLYDDGTHGDVSSGDKLFTNDLSISAATLGRVYFRAGAAFRGNTVNAWSTAAAVDVDPIRMPPDPGEAGRQTLKGIDSDNDDVRDDVQRYIAITYPDEIRRRVLTQYAIALEPHSGTDDDRALAQQAAVACTAFTFNDASWDRATKALRSAVLNTQERLREYTSLRDRSTATLGPLRVSQLSQYCK